MTQGRKPAELPIPDLVIDPIASKPSRRGRIPNLRNEASFDLELEGTAPMSGGQLPQVDFDEPLPGGNLDLDVVPTRTTSPKHAGQDWPVGATPTPHQLTIDANQLQRCNPYGEPPRHLLETPVYAWMVYRNQVRLKRELEQARLRLEQAEQRRDAALAQWTDAIRAQLLGDERFARMLGPLLTEEASLSRDVHHLDHLREDMQRDQLALDASEQALKRQIEDAEAVCRVQSAQLADLERNLAREQAKRKRIDIEARAGGTVPSEALNLLSRITEADSAVQAASETIEQARRALTEANRVRSARQLELRQLEDRRRLAQRKGQQVTSDAVRGVASTERSLEQKKADVGRAVLALREPKYVDPATIEQLRSQDQAILTLATEYEYLNRAFFGFDRQAVKRGLWFSILSLGLCALLLLFRIVF